MEKRRHPGEVVEHQIGKNTNDRVYERLSEEELRSRSKRAALDARDLKRINAAADQLNAEAEDVLTYQVLPWGESD